MNARSSPHRSSVAVGGSAPRWSRSAQRAAKWALGWTAVCSAFHVYWALGGDFGYGDGQSVTPSTTSSISGWLFTVVVFGMSPA